MNLSSVDLNLLVIFNALYEQGQVTRAARKVALTQPAVSNALARLRALFQDPLFVRVGNSMEPTPKARELSRPIAALLTQLSEVFGPTEFVPARTQLTIQIATTDHIEIALLPRLMCRLTAQAPMLKLVTRRLASVFEVPREELESGGIDLAIGPFPQPQAPNSNITDQRIYTEEVVCILRAAHPLARRKLTLDAFAKAEHVVVYYPGKGSGLIDRLLEQHGKKRRVAIVVPHFFSAACIVANSDYIATVPNSLARFLAKPLNLSVVKLPVAAPWLLIGMFWHRRNAADRASIWVREVIADTARELGFDRAGPEPPIRSHSGVRHRDRPVQP